MKFALFDRAHRGDSSGISKI